MEKYFCYHCQREVEVYTIATIDSFIRNKYVKVTISVYCSKCEELLEQHTIDKEYPSE